MSKQKFQKWIKEVILSNFDRKVLVTDTITDVSILKDYDPNEDFHSKDLDFLQDENGNDINEEYENAFCQSSDRINLSFINSYFEKVKKENPNIDPNEIVLTYDYDYYCVNFRISHFREETDEEYQERLNSYELRKLEKQKKKVKSQEELLERIEKLKKELGET